MDFELRIWLAGFLVPILYWQCIPCFEIGGSVKTLLAGRSGAVGNIRIPGS